MSSLVVFLSFLINAIVSVEIWDIYETHVTGPSSGNPFKEIQVTATFTSASKTETKITGFYNGNGIYSFRFMPNELGHWTYSTNSNNPNVEDATGDFQVTNATKNNRGPVYAVNNVNSSIERPYFIYADTGDIYFESGTTSYGWIELPSNITSQTISTIKDVYNNNIFNKIRMAIFPINGPYQHIEPSSFPFTGSLATNWDNFTAFNLTFWSKLDSFLTQLQDIGIVIDLILFHGYDEWGFKCMGGSNVDEYDISNDLFYLQYVVSRLSAYRNIWWSMANEYDEIKCKHTDIPYNFSIWDSYFEALMEYDPYTNPPKEKSIHQWKTIYNYSQSWVTHFSIHGYQNVDYKYYFEKYNVTKALVLDEIQYEGNLTAQWGNLSAVSELDRYWMCTAVGMQVGHSESLLPNATNDPSQTAVTWWNYGNVLRGESYKKIKFYYEFMTNDSIHPPFHKLFTFCYVPAIYNYFNSNFTDVAACYVSQLYDKNEYSYYLVRFANITENQSMVNYEYNSTVNLKLENGEYIMYKVDEWNQEIILLNDNINVKADEGYTYTAKTLPQTLQFINKNSKYRV